MTDELPPIADRYRNIARGFTERVEAVPDDAWANPAPPEGWDARDVVRHLVEWVPPFLRSGLDVELAPIPSVDDDPAAAWRTLDAEVQRLLDDPAESAREFSHPRAGTHRLDDAIATFVMGDVLMHTWDLARAVGLDERLDPTEVDIAYRGMLPLDEMLRASGQFGPRIEVPDDADTQTKLIAFVGRVP